MFIFFKLLLLKKKHLARKAKPYVVASSGMVDLFLFKSLSPKVGCGHNGGSNC